MVYSIPFFRNLLQHRKTVKFKKKRKGRQDRKGWVKKVRHGMQGLQDMTGQDRTGWVKKAGRASRTGRDRAGRFRRAQVGCPGLLAFF